MFPCLFLIAMRTLKIIRFVGKSMHKGYANLLLRLTLLQCHQLFLSLYNYFSFLLIAKLINIASWDVSCMPTEVYTLRAQVLMRRVTRITFVHPSLNS